METQIRAPHALERMAGSRAERLRRITPFDVSSAISSAIAEAREIRRKVASRNRRGFTRCGTRGN
jgi:hypothetical protein